MITITRKVFSYCNDFTDKEQEELGEEVSCDVYIDYTANSERWFEDNGYENDIVSNKLMKLGCSEGEDILIHIDY